MRALEKSAQFTPGTRIDRWLFTILHSLWISELRARHVRMGQGFAESDQLLAPDDREMNEDRLQYQQLMCQVSALPEAQRNAVFLVYVEGFTYQEAADTLSIPIGTVMSRLAAARLTLVKSTAAPTSSREKRS